MLFNDKKTDRRDRRNGAARPPLREGILDLTSNPPAHSRLREPPAARQPQPSQTIRREGRSSPLSQARPPLLLAPLAAWAVPARLPSPGPALRCSFTTAAAQWKPK